MDKVIENLFCRCESVDIGIYQQSLSDLRYVIERFSMNRYSVVEEEDYESTFYDKKLLSYRLDDGRFKIIKHFVFYLLFNYPDRAFWTAKCAKVIFDIKTHEALCNAIKVYMDSDDDVTVELLYGIINSDDQQSYLLNQNIVDLFKRVKQLGGSYSKKIVESELKCLEKGV